MITDISQIHRIAAWLPVTIKPDVRIGGVTTDNCCRPVDLSRPVTRVTPVRHDAHILDRRAYSWSESGAQTDEMLRFEPPAQQAGDHPVRRSPLDFELDQHEDHNAGQDCPVQWSRELIGEGADQYKATDDQIAQQHEDRVDDRAELKTTRQRQSPAIDLEQLALHTKHQRIATDHHMTIRGRIDHGEREMNKQAPSVATVASNGDARGGRFIVLYASRDLVPDGGRQGVHVSRIHDEPTNHHSDEKQGKTLADMAPRRDGYTSATNRQREQSAYPAR